MWIKAVVTGPGGRHAEHAADAREEGDVAAVISAAVKEYRHLYPDAPPFDFSIRVSEA